MPDYTTDVFKNLENNKFSYKKLQSEGIVSLLEPGKEFTVNVIIGVRGRQEFYETTIKYFQEAFNYFNEMRPEKGYTFCLTFVEHDEKPNGRNILEGKVNYLWSSGPDSNFGKEYNRSFVYNFGVKFGPKSLFLLTHDLDCIPKKDFFLELFDNLGDNQVLQPYGNRRILYLSKDLTKKVLSGEEDINNFTEQTPGVTPPQLYGSKGGSLFLSTNVFYEIGGFCDTSFGGGYSAEDKIIWTLIQTMEYDIAYADYPPIDIFHLNHEPLWAKNPFVHQMDETFYLFERLGKSERLRFIELQKTHFLEQN